MKKPRVRGPDMTNAERQARHRARQKEDGLVQLNLMIPMHAVADFMRAAELVRANRALTVGRLTDTRSGKLRGLKGEA